MPHRCGIALTPRHDLVNGAAKHRIPSGGFRQRAIVEGPMGVRHGARRQSTKALAAVRHVLEGGAIPLSICHLFLGHSGRIRFFAVVLSR